MGANIQSPSDNKYFILPDLILACPFRYTFNPHSKDIASASSAWINVYAEEMFGDRKSAEFPASHLHNITYYTYPYADPERLRTCSDFIHLLFFLDEASDEMNGADAQAIGDVFMSAMADEYDSLSDGPGSTTRCATKDFKKRFWDQTSATSQRRFIESAKAYTAAVAREAGLREQGEVLNIDEYIKIRRQDSAVLTTFSLFEYALGIEIPDWVFEESTFQLLYYGAADMVCWSNDIYSYKMERAKGLAGNNIVTVLMQTQGMTLQAAIDVAGEHFKALVQQHIDTKQKLPSWGAKVDSAVSQYIMALECWVIGNSHWSFSTPRYFGGDEVREEIKRTHVVKL